MPHPPCHPDTAAPIFTLESSAKELHNCEMCLLGQDEKDSAHELFEDVYIVLNLMESDLDRIIASSQPLTEQHH
jgi:predicted site-specific integrase-resolvase